MLRTVGMKIPAHILGLLVAGVVAPTVAGCAVDTDPAPPQPSTVDSELQRANEEEPAAPPEQPSQPTQPTSTAPEQPTPPPVDESAPTDDDPCPPCGMG